MAIETLGVIRGQIIAREIEVEVLRRNQSANTFSVQRAQAELDALRGRYNLLLRGQSPADAEGYPADEQLTVAD